MLFNIKTPLLLSLVAETALASKPYAQTSQDQYNVLHYLSAHGPYVDGMGYGIDPETPYGTEVVQAHILMRHGERYPTISADAELHALYKRLTNADVDEYEGPLSFVEDWEYIFDKDDLETESSEGPYAGLTRCKNTGKHFYERYGHLWDNSTIPIFAASQARVVASAEAFGKGFGAGNLEDVKIVVINETTIGGNSLTPYSACPAYNETIHEDIVGEFKPTFYEREAARLNHLSPGFNLTGDNVQTLIKFCAYDLNVAGNSTICKILSPDVYVGFAYYRDLDLYYNYGPGYNMTNVAGSAFVNATLSLLNEEQDSNLFMSFSHDTDIAVLTTAFGLFDDSYDLPTDQIDFTRPYQMNNIIPMAANIIIEKLKEGKKEYVRFIINNSVYPLPYCSSGPGFSCPLKKFSEYLSERVEEDSFEEYCDLAEGESAELTFFWDWQDADYEIIDLS